MSNVRLSLLLSFLCATKGVKLWHPQKREEAKEMAIQKQWQRNQSHTTGAAITSFSNHDYWVKQWEWTWNNVSRLSAFLYFLPTRSRAASPPSLLVSTPPTPTSPPLIQTPRRSVPNHQTHLQMCPVFRRTSAGWLTTVSPFFFF